MIVRDAQGTPWIRKCFRREATEQYDLDAVALLKTDPPNAYSTTDTDSHLLSDIGDTLLTS